MFKFLHFFYNFIYIFDKNNYFNENDYLFLVKPVQNETYNITDFVTDIKKFYDESTLYLILILILFFPFLTIFPMFQKLMQYFLMLWYTITILLNIITKKKLVFEPFVKLDNFNFSWTQIFIINFYDVPRAHAFMWIYAILNKTLKH